MPQKGFKIVILSATRGFFASLTNLFTICAIQAGCRRLFWGHEIDYLSSSKNEAFYVFSRLDFRSRPEILKNTSNYQVEFYDFAMILGNAHYSSCVRFLTQRHPPSPRAEFFGFFH